MDRQTMFENCKLWKLWKNGFSMLRTFFRPFYVSLRCRSKTRASRSDIGFAGATLRSRPGAHPARGRNNERHFPCREVPPRAGTSMVNEKILIRPQNRIFQLFKGLTINSWEINMLSPDYPHSFLRNGVWSSITPRLPPLTVMGWNVTFFKELQNLLQLIEKIHPSRGLSRRNIWNPDIENLLFFAVHYSSAIFRLSGRL